MTVTASLPPDDCVNDDQQAAADDGQVERPAEHGGENDGRRVNGDAGGQPALQEKQGRAEQAGLGVETLAQIFVGGIDIQPPVNRQEDRGDDDQRQRQAEIILHETQVRLDTLAGRGEKRDGAGLGGHDRKADGEPARVLRRPSSRCSGSR